MVGAVYENKGRSMRHTAVMAENRIESSEGNYTSGDKNCNVFDAEQQLPCPKAG